ncbi:MAG: hypothetical protein KA479_10480 [Saprospiraceae bacterium]|nr:hypothetical protein [Saprospiraceae bacterium]
MDRRKLILLLLHFLALILTGLVIQEVWQYHTKKQSQKAQDRIDLFYIDLKKKDLYDFNSKLVDSRLSAHVGLYDSILTCLSNLEHGGTVPNESIKYILHKSNFLETRYIIDMLREIGDSHLTGAYNKLLSDPVQLKKHLFFLALTLAMELRDAINCMDMGCFEPNTVLSYGWKPESKDSLLVFIHERICPNNECSKFRYHVLEDIKRNFVYLNKDLELSISRNGKFHSNNPILPKDTRLLYHIKNLPQE